MERADEACHLVVDKVEQGEDQERAAFKPINIPK